MKTRIKNLFVAKWWNPLFWLFVVIAPVVGAIAGMLSGVFYGLLVGYEKGLAQASRKLHRFVGTI